jgi:TetR/AcrR family transcriptional regulator
MNSDQSAENERSKRLPAEERRRQLIETAVDLFSRHGFDGTTTRSIAGAAGVSEAILFRHFASKQELYGAILEHKLRQSGQEEWFAGMRAIAERDDDERLFLELARKVLESYRTDPQFRRVMLYASLEGHEIARIAERMIGIPVFEFLRGYIARRQEQGAFRRMDPAVVAIALAGITSFYGMVTRLFGVALVDVPDDDVAAAFADIVLRGLRAPAAEDSESE